MLFSNFADCIRIAFCGRCLAGYNFETFALVRDPLEVLVDGRHGDEKYSSFVSGDARISDDLLQVFLVLV